MTKEESISVISRIRDVLLKNEWFDFSEDGTDSNPDGSNTDTHIHMTRILWDEDNDFDGDESWDIHFDEDDGYITAEYEDSDNGIPLNEFIDETNLENGELEQYFINVFSREPGYGRNLAKLIEEEGGRE